LEILRAGLAGHNLLLTTHWRRNSGVGFRFCRIVLVLKVQTCCPRTRQRASSSISSIHSRVVSDVNRNGLHFTALKLAAAGWLPDSGGSTPRLLRPGRRPSRRERNGSTSGSKALITTISTGARCSSISSEAARMLIAGRHSYPARSSARPNQNVNPRSESMTSSAANSFLLYSFQFGERGADC
jgi:hypothetical protein